MNKALTYLGLKDIDDDELYDEYDEEPRPYRSAHTVYPDAAVEPAAEARVSPASTVRPVPNEDTGRQAIVRPLIPRSATARVHVVAPSVFGEAQEIGDLIKQNSPVIVNLQLSDRDLARRMIDFCSGLTYALGGAMEKVADQVFLLTPSNVEVSAEERLRLQQRGLYQS
jgi:cell division inhibitor SepF